MTYGKVELASADGKTAFVMTDMKPHVTLQLKRFMPRLNKMQTKHLSLQANEQAALDLEWFGFRWPLHFSSDAQKLHDDLLKTAHARANETKRLVADEYKPGLIPAGFRDGERPYDFQQQTADLVTLNRRLLLMDELGWGKSISAIATLLTSKTFPAAIVVEAHVTEQWQKEMVQRFTTLRVHIIKGTKPYDLPDADIYIFTYHRTAGWVDVIAEGMFKSVIFDEVHNLRRGTASAKGMAAIQLCANASLVMGLSATPIFNYGGEIWNIINILWRGSDNEDPLGDRDEFVREWCTYSNGKCIVDHPEALGAMMLEYSLAQRRTEADGIVDRQLPPLNPPILVHVDYDTSKIMDIEAEARALAMTVINGSFVEKGTAARELDIRMRHATGVAKAAKVAAFVRMLVEGGEQVLLGGWHRDVYDIWQDHLSDLGIVFYTGSESQSRKIKAKAAFVSGQARIMAMSLRSGAGLDGLQHCCRTVVFGELDWSPMVHRQFIGRVRRPGQTETVDTYYLNTDGGSDPAIVETLGLKSSQAHGIIDPFADTSSPNIEPDVSRITRLAKQLLRNQ